MKLSTREFLKQLKDDIEKKLDGYEFKNKSGKKAKLKGYVQALPVLNTKATLGNVADSEETSFPFFVVRLSEVKTSGKMKKLSIYVLFALCDDDKSQNGYLTLIDCLDEIMFGYQQFNVLGVYTCDEEMEIMLQEDDSFPQFYGGITMDWWTKPPERVIPGWE